MYSDHKPFAGVSARIAAQAWAPQTTLPSRRGAEIRTRRPKTSRTLTSVFKDFAPMDAITQTGLFGELQDDRS
jgi:hypothetical protein